MQTLTEQLQKAEADIENNAITLKFLWTGEQSAGNTMTLNDDITNYSALIVSSGSVSSYTYTSQLVVVWYGRKKFGVDEDTINGKTYSGTFQIQSTASKTLYVKTASDNIRAIIGIKGLVI